jgi:PAS domain S-box-containing protein
LGFERDEIIGRDSTPFTHPEDIGITEESHRRIAKGELQQSRYVKRYLRKDGRLIYVEVLRSPARDADRNFLYNVISERDITDERALAAQLSHQALQAGELSMHYQPIVKLDTGELVGFESLMRWPRATRGWVPPDVFIPAAEQSDLIIDLGYFSINESIKAACSWGADDLFITVNLSARQFHDLGLIAFLDSMLLESKIRRGRLFVEITESVTLHNVRETMSVMEQLTQLGISFALDDFGTGFSSLSYLALLHPEIIKVDRSFVSPKIERSRNDVLLEAIITLGHKLEMTMLAEGVETLAQAERLRGLDCELGQGFLWSAAVPLNEVKALLKERRPLDARRVPESHEE